MNLELGGFFSSFDSLAIGIEAIAVGGERIVMKSTATYVKATFGQ